ncbi:MULTISPECIES: ureidoglycolate lyase [unclassified Rhizobium]|uniref:ureidoglycolate lyase n=1 Tax=unclassified Rhizobium TaxID=2613769 RepID=UPI0017808E48|nr:MULTISPECIES: ureidoglycolate lyase [unclassified Rhizobium]MBD8686749.1 ureidoglycolate lyase [Rhizobium sp. CFBP 13644]MBD8691448.1 ureidoglycolate lyase [Rhizobium sp. CFBP 13717]
MTDFLEILPLTKAAFAPFGDVIETDSATVRLINGGNTERHHALAAADVTGEGARVVLNIFRGKPRQFPYAVDMMERHPLGSQSFTPLSGNPFLVVVAQDDEGRPGKPHVFLARASQGVNYHRNVWHHPLMTLGSTSDFLVVDRDGPGNNLEESFFDRPYFITDPQP